jgi:hypothetical protein
MVASPTNHMLLLRNREISMKDFINIGKQVTSIIFDKCVSNEWKEILNGVANLKEVMELTITHCGLRDEHI